MFYRAEYILSWQVVSWHLKIICTWLFGGNCSSNVNYIKVFNSVCDLFIFLLFFFLLVIPIIYFSLLVISTIDIFNYDFMYGSLQFYQFFCTYFEGTKESILNFCDCEVFKIKWLLLIIKSHSLSLIRELLGNLLFLV